MGGTTVETKAVRTGEKFRMVIDEKQNNELLELGTFRPGGWATRDFIPDANYARNQLAITEGYKSGPLYVVEVETTAPQTAREGVVGAQGDLRGGGNQVQFLDYGRVKPVSKPRPLH